MTILAQNGSTVQSPVRPTLAEMLASGERADALMLAPPCICGDCATCDDDLAHDLAEALGLEDDGPDMIEAREQWAAISGSEWERRQRRLADYYRDGRFMGRSGCPLAVSRLMGDEELCAAYTSGWVAGAEELAEAMPLPPSLLDRAERAGFFGEPLCVPPGLSNHHVEEFAAAWEGGRRCREWDEEELAAEGFGRSMWEGGAL